MSECIALDALALQVRSAGIAVYTEGLVRHLAAARPGTTFVLYGIGGPARAVLGWTRATTDAAGRAPLPPNVVWHRSALYPLRMGYPPPGLPRVLPLSLGPHAPQVFHATNYAAPRSDRVPLVVTVHDLALLRFPELGTPALCRLVARARNAAQTARLVVADSHATATDVTELLDVAPERIRIVYPGCDARFRPQPAAEARQLVAARLGIAEPYILHVGTLEPRKNLARLVTAVATLRRRGVPHRLVCAGAPAWGADALRRHIAATGMDDAVRLLGPVPAALLPPLYAAAAVVAYPSLYEGFGLPVVEAMACGTPVVTANTSALPEVAGDAALYTDPRDADAIAAALELALHDQDTRARLITLGLQRARAFTWECCARAMLSVYDEARG